jgi:glutathione S-transferase
MADITLWGFDGSTHVRTVKMLLAEKHVSNFKQIPLNVARLPLLAAHGSLPAFTV